MQRRELITLLGGAAVAWPLAARAQQPERMRHIGVLMGLDPNDAWGAKYLRELKAALGSLGWSEGRNIRIDVRAAGDLAGLRALATEVAKVSQDCRMEFAPSINFAKSRAIHALSTAARNVVCATKEPSPLLPILVNQEFPRSSVF